MPIMTLRFVTIILTALNLGMAFCHLLQLPPRMSYDAALWMTTTHTLFPLFAIVGAPIEIGSILAATALTYLVRGRKPAFGWTLIGAALLVTAQVIWWVLVAPANAEIATWTPDAFPADWARWRARWEYTHATRALLQLIGLGVLVTSVLAETPTSVASDRAADGARLSKIGATR